MSPRNPPGIGRPVSQPITPRTIGGDPSLVVRPRLQSLLPPVPATPLTVVQAPAGYGKSVLVSRWVTLRAALPVAWVGLRSTDDGRRVGMRLLAGLEEIGLVITSAIGDALPVDGHDIGGRFLSVLRQKVGDLDDLVLVIDGLDAPRRPGLRDELERWILTLPPNVRTVVTRRSRAPVTMSESQRGVTTLDSEDLACTPGEIRAVIGRVTDIDLHADQLSELVRRTEGWPLAVQVVATEMRRGIADVDTVIARLHGGEPHLAAVFGGEVLQFEADPVIRFLQQTSVLDTLNPSLCAAVVGAPMAEPILRMLERTGAFTTRLPGRPGEFRYQELFREFLRLRLRAAEPGADARLLARASEWYARQGRIEPAVRYGMESEDGEVLVALVDRFARQQYERNEPQPLLEVLDAVRGRNDFDVALRRAHLLTMTGRTRQAEQVLHGPDATPVHSGDDAAVLALRASWVFLDAAPQRSLEAANAALDLLHGNDLGAIPKVLGITSPQQLEYIALGAHARALWSLGELESSRTELLDIVDRSDVYLPWLIQLLGATAMLEAWSGNLRAAVARARRALLLAGGADLLGHPVALEAKLAVAHTLVERADLLRSERVLTSLEGRVRRSGRPVAVAIWVVERASLCLAGGQIARGLSLIRELRAGGDPSPTSIVTDRLRATEARLLLAAGETDRAEEAVALVGTPLGGAGGVGVGVGVEIAVLRGDLAVARQQLDTWPVRPTDLRGRIERELWRGIVEMESGEPSVAVRRLSGGVIRNAALEGHRQLLLETGLPGEHLLQALLRSEPTRFVEDVLRSAGSRRLAVGGVAGLSVRELEILRYLPTDLSSAEIADRLFISLNTLKTHLRAIYRKLGVSGRRQAIERAAALGIA